MSDFYDQLETRSPDQREAELFAALPAQIAHARANAPYFARLLADVDPASIRDRAALSRLPVTRKSDLIALQKDAPPFGGLAAIAIGQLARVFASPGPIHDPEPHGKDPWRSARALYASGIRGGDLVQNCFAYHLTPAGSMFETGAHALGAAVIPAGTGNTEMQAQVIAQLKPKAYIGTPDFLKIILEKGDELGLDVSSLKVGHVAGGPFLPDARAFYEGRGINVYQSYGTADLGIVAYETPARAGLVVEEGAIIEIVRPGTGDPVPEGEVGEVVVTIFNPAYPLVRFATGDLSAVLPGQSPCGRTNMRLKGWMGRADQTTKVKGMFVHPQQVAEVVRRHPQVAKARLVVGRQDANDTMTLRCEAAESGEALASSLRETLASVTKLKGTVEFVAPGTLPNDGKVIDDTRT
ncbi:phenylacetate--CoA ligase family protein [Azospirillum rugosum]|uniref:Phenylacetate-CoA ligase n=1 Tax=Azospirillum rugosum TaxID=416170 RepID=A0ABS4SFL8_9PROT|nr:AMP-binding protein [Azospirillum rugosum]MBP2291369.1 phenylacetate-CoA ligase [Azospirillum rugosum]MDQ0525157.1 phenylacetate-CoA ligase [Azospirillum rugosum]